MKFLAVHGAQFRTIGIPLCFIVLWSSGFVALKAGLAYSDPLTFLTLRYSLVVAVLVCVLLIQRQGLRISWTAVKHNVVLGLLLHVGYFGLITMSFSQGMSATGIALIMSLQPAMVGLVSAGQGTKAFGSRTWAGLIVGTVGAIIVISSQSSIGSISMIGAGLAVLALFSISGSAIWESRSTERSDPVASNAIHYSVGLVILAPLAYFTESMHVTLGVELIASLFYLVFGNSLLAIYLLLTMLREGDATRVSSFFFLVPPITLVISMIVLGESLPIFAFPGIFMTAVGVYLSNTAREVQSSEAPGA